MLITGVAGFIGFHLAKTCLRQGNKVIGIDNLNEYYDVELKKERLRQLSEDPNFSFFYLDINNLLEVQKIFENYLPQRVVHLAAQAGVRYSLKNPHLYIQSNLVGFTNIIEACHHYQVEHLVYASTSAVYGANTNLPYKESTPVNHPLSIYAATKKANELIAHAYSHLYQLSTIGLRFFTVYGPWGRPDMAFFSFTRDILAGKPIQVYNNGLMQRDFTYIDDIVSGILQALSKPTLPDENWSGKNPKPHTSYAPYKIYNLGCNRPVNLLDYIQAIEKATGKKAIKQFLPLQAGDVVATHADISTTQAELGYFPKTDFQEGVNRFVDWYLNYYHRQLETC